MDLKNLRQEYCSQCLSEELRKHDPYEIFKSWFEAAESIIPEPNAMCLATATKDGKPSVRFVLLKDYDKDLNLTFYTNYNSRKALQLNENPYASATLYWEPLHRSVRFEGHCKKLNPDQNNEYFAQRCCGSQISAIISRQSQPVKDRNTLEQLTEELESEAQHEIDKTVGNKSKYGLHCPENWGGYLLIPHRIEFWQGQTNRLHDRFLFRKKEHIRSNSLEFNDPDPTLWANETNNGIWICQRLFP